MEQITIDFLPAGATAVCHASQFDAGRVIRMNLRNDGAVYTLSGSEIIKAKITRPDGTSIVENIENTASSYVDLVTSAGTCDVSGTNKGELVIEKDGATIGSKNFRMEVEEDAYGGGAGVVVESASGAIASFETDIEDELVELKAKIEPVQDLHGYTHPWAGGAGKNKLDINALKNTNNWSTSYPDSGEMPASWSNPIYTIGKLVAGKTYTLSFEYADPDFPKYLYFGYYDDEGVTKRLADLTTGSIFNRTYTFIAEENLYYCIRIQGSTKFEENLSYINAAQFEEGSSATAWEPYENICPISGHDEVNITRTGKNLITANVPANTVYWGTNQTSIISALNKLPAGIYTISNKYKINSLPGNNKVQHGKVYITALVNGTQIPVNTYSATIDNSPFVNKVYEEVGTFEITEEIKGNINHAYLYCDQADTHSGTNRGTYTFFDLQVEKGSSATEYLQYAGETKTIEFDDTVYSAELDTKNGELAKDGYIESYNGETIEEPWISSKDAFVPGTTPTAGAQVVYKKSTPDKVSSGTANFSTLTDQTNHVYNDTGDTSLKYYKRAGRATA